MNLLGKCTQYFILKSYNISSLVILKPKTVTGCYSNNLNCSRLYTNIPDSIKYRYAPVLQGRTCINGINFPNNRKHLDINCEAHIQNVQNQNKKTIVTSKVIYKDGYRSSQENKTHRRSVLYYIISIGVLVTGMSYASVPLYRIFCQAYSYGGTTQQADLNTRKVQTMRKIKDRNIRIQFNADTASSMRWNFKPQQSEITVIPGETALAFYTACNPTNETVIGVSTYNVVPFEAGQYFNKIQCFCFEEQLLNPNEEVNMPVFFYIDPEFDEDPKMEDVDDIVLSYTFFEVKEGHNIPLPGFMKH